ncbi:MAG: ATP-dependent Lon protease [Planctomycetota bacterium]|jgi:ATP-dependent Lon protease
MNTKAESQGSEAASAGVTRAELARLEAAVEAAYLPPEARQAAKRELVHLHHTPPTSADAIRTMNWLEWMLGLPWPVPSTPQAHTLTKADLRQAAAALESIGDDLDKRLCGLEEVKQRVLEHLAARVLGGHGRGAILCFIGPPGTGKTSMGRAIAVALDRALIEINAGSIAYERELRGRPHRLDGAWPGAILSGLHKAQANNPVLLIDEIDKLALGPSGDSAGALLRVLDREYNASFGDHYLGVPYDLSQCVFVATAVDADAIPVNLLDRLELIEFGSYTEEEKICIARKHLIPSAREFAGLAPADLLISKSSLASLIHHYTAEAGIRHLGRLLESLARKAALGLIQGRGGLSIKKSNLFEILGPAFADDEISRRKPAVGIASGLAWTSAGGALLPVEVVMMPGGGRTILTGRVGDTMRESVQTAISYVRTRLGDIGVEPTALEHLDVHMHFPSTSVPKDGPSGGIAIATALLSLLADIPVRNDIAMSGELTLHGEVLPVGGLREKVLVAIRLGYRAVVVPARNEEDIRKLPADVTSAIDIHLVDHADQVFQVALLPEPAENKVQPQSIRRISTKAARKA